MVNLSILCHALFSGKPQQVFHSYEKVFNSFWKTLWKLRYATNPAIIIFQNSPVNIRKTLNKLQQMVYWFFLMLSHMENNILKIGQNRTTGKAKKTLP
jgi:hypothetical protein